MWLRIRSDRAHGRYTAWPVLNKPYVAVYMTSKVRMLNLLDLLVVSLSHFGSYQQPRNTVNEKINTYFFCALVIYSHGCNFAELFLSHACFCLIKCGTVLVLSVLAQKECHFLCPECSDFAF